MASNGEFDVAIIGGGPGGYTAAFRAAQLGMKAALVEVFKLGGVCLIAGCIPYKALLENVRVINLLKRKEEFGLKEQGGEEIDFSAMMERKNRIVGRLHDGLHALVKKHGVTYFEGLGSFLGPNRLKVRNLKDRSEREITAKNVVVATGSKPKFIPMFAADGETILFSDHIVDLAACPKSLAVLGGGPIGVETATVLKPLGCEVTILEAMPRIMPMEDEEISIELERRLKEQEIGIITGAKVTESKKVKDGVRLTFSDAAGQEKTLSAEKLLVAIGRDGLVSGLSLEAGGVEVERSFIKVNEKMQTNVPGIYAIGDVVGPPLLAHKASAEALLAVETMAGQDSPRVDLGKIPHCTYCQPQVASIGLTEAQAKETGGDVKVGRFSFKINGKALCEGEAEGFVKIVSDARTGELLGAHMIGSEVTELIMECSEAMYAENTLYELTHAIHAHPTRSEAVKEAALDVTKEALSK